MTVVDPNMRLTLIDDGPRYAYMKHSYRRHKRAHFEHRKFIATEFLLRVSPRLAGDSLFCDMDGLCECPIDVLHSQLKYNCFYCIVGDMID